ncbi:MAG: tyrosine-type recombinase/integrase [Candidatus Lokiarchaeota archaeon]
MNSITNQEIIDRYLERFSYSKHSQRMRKYCLRYFFHQNYFGYKGHIFDITKRDVIDYFDYLNQLDTIALQTKKNKWNIFRSFLQFIMEYYDDFLIVIPRYSIQWKPIHKKPKSNKDVVMTKAEVKRILDHLFNHNYKYYLLYRLLAETGMRIGELLSIDCSDLNLKKRYVEAEGKTGRKIYYFSENLAKHLEIYMQERKLKKADTPALFLSIQKKRYALRTVNHYLRKTVIRLEIGKWISCHTFRRTLNTLRKRMGCSKEDRKILLCHKVSDVNFNCYVKLNYTDYIRLYDTWNPYKNILER